MVFKRQKKTESEPKKTGVPVDIVLIGCDSNEELRIRQLFDSVNAAGDTWYRFQSIQPSEELLNQSREALLSIKPPLIFVNQNVFSSIAALDDFLSSSARLLDYQLGQIILISSNLNAFFNQATLVRPTPQLFMKGQEPMSFYREDMIQTKAEVQDPFQGISPTPKPLASVSLDEDKRLIFFDEISGIQWRDNNYRSEKFIRQVSRRLSPNNERIKPIGFIRKEEKLGLFSGFALSEMSCFSFEHYSLEHILSWQDLEKGSLNLKKAIEKITRSISLAGFSRLKSDMLSAEKPLMVNKPVRIHAEQPIAADILADILRQRGFQRVDTNFSEDQDQAFPFVVNIYLDQFVAEEDAVDWSQDHWQMMQTPELEKRIVEFSFKSVPIAKLPALDKLRQQLLQRQQKLKKHQLEEKKFASQKAMQGYELKLANQATAKLDLLEKLIESAAINKEEELDQYALDKILILSEEKDIARRYMRQVSQGSKPLWLDISELYNWQQAASLKSIVYEKYLNDGAIVLDEKEKPTILSKLEKLKQEASAVQAAQQALSSNEQEHFDEQLQLEDEYSRVLYYHYWAQLNALLHQKYNGLRDLCRLSMVEMFSYMFRLKQIQSVQILASEDLQASEMEKACLEYFPELAAENIYSSVLDLSLIGELDLSEKKEVWKEQREPAEIQAAVQKKLARKNAPLIKTFLESLMNNLQLHSESSLLMVEQDIDLLFYTMRAVRSADSVHKHKPVLALVKGDIREEKLEKLAHAGVGVLLKVREPVMDSRLLQVQMESFFRL